MISESKRPIKTIQSFVRRSSKLTPGQRNGIDKLWSNYGLDIPKGYIDLDKVFNNTNPRVLEIGFGNGDSLLSMAINTPNKNFLGVEVYEAGIGRLINEAHKVGIDNLRVVKFDAVELLHNHIDDDSFESLQLFFPDPWHKKKHHKRRIVNSNFLNLISKKLIKNAVIHMATDWESYAQQMMDSMENHKNFKNRFGAHIYSSSPGLRPITKFEKRGQKLGHKVWDLMFINNK
jgi:tRNA (guanine-N7-)-methyltransferase